MDNKKISFIIINEQTKKTNAFSLSFLYIKIIKILAISLIIVSSYFLIKNFNKSPYQSQMSAMYITENKIKSLLDLLINKGLASDSLLNEFNLLDDYNNLNNFLPIAKPVEGIITRGIINDKSHKHHGLDIAAVFQSEVMATQRGIVIMSNKVNHLGNTIIIAHPNNYYSLYAHLDKTIISKYDFVEKNQVIGYVGKADNGEGPHLHFEIWHNNLIIDPRNLIDEYKEKDVSIR